MSIYLKKRLITGLLLGLVGTVCVIKLPHPYFLILSTACLLLSIWEWSGLVYHFALRQPQSEVYKKHHKGGRLCYMIAVLILGYLAHQHSEAVLWTASVWWIVAALLLMDVVPIHGPSAIYIALQATMGYLVLIPCWLAANNLHYHDPALFLYVLVLVYVGDIAAYFLGSWKGRHKICKRISPGKTVEGWLAGLAAAIGLAVITGLWLEKATFKMHLPLYKHILLGCLVSVLGLLGDLLESFQKRLAGVKDSGHYLPGHGGILDRIDSLAATLPIVALWLIF